MYKVIYDFGSLRLDPLWIVLVVASLLLLAMAQSYASARKLRLGPALILNLAVLVVGDAIVYLIFITVPYWRQNFPPDYVFKHVSIYSYGFMLMVAFVLGTIWLIVQGKREKPKVEIDTILDLMIFIIIGSIIGARGIYILTQMQHYQGADAPRMLQITEGGLSIHGGVIGAMLAGWIYIKAKGVNYWQIVDFAIPAVPLGMFLGRIGCFLNGCCYGIESMPGFPLRTHFPDAADWQARGLNPEQAQLYDSGQAALKEWRHPAQLYEAIGALLIHWYLVSFRHNKVFKGHVFLMFVWLYSVLRFVVEFYRFGDPETGQGSSIVLWKVITLAQVASLVLGILAWFLMVDLKRRAYLAKLLSEGEEVPQADPEVFEEEEEEAEGDVEPEEGMPEDEAANDKDSSSEGLISP